MEIDGCDRIVAVDDVGAGIGELVLVATGSAARLGCGDPNSPVDACIVGIVDDPQKIVIVDKRQVGVVDMVSMLDLKNALFEGGVVGAGGAGFPTHAKLSDQADTVILNCAECEPLIKVDRQLMVDYINEILSGMQMMVEAMGAKEGIIAVKKSYTASIEAVKSNIGNYKNLRLHILPDIYPAGDEVVLIYETTGRIVPQGKIPILVGCVVCNVETVLINLSESYQRHQCGK